MEDRAKGKKYVYMCFFLGNQRGGRRKGGKKEEKWH
jgi:hypothetical protein